MNWILYLIRRRRINSELAEEIQAHISERIDNLVEAGMEDRDARRQAAREFGNTTRYLEMSRETWGWSRLETAIRDLRHGVRMMRRSPGFTGAALLSLTLGIGANSAIFSILHSLLLTPLPFRSPGDLVEIYQTHPRLPEGYKSGTSLPDLVDWKAHSVAFEDFTASDWTRHHLLGAEAPVYIHGLRVAENFFSLLGSNASLGRTFVDEDFRPARKVIILSHRAWARHFNADVKIIGRTIRLDEQPYEVVGVMPPDFRYPPYAPPVPGMVCEMWEPMIPTAAERTERSYNSATVLGRIRSGHSLGQAKAELDAVMSHLARTYPESNAGWTAILEPLAERVTKDLRPALLLLVAAVVLVLTIACANVANLLLARSSARSREIALRVALGASRSRLVMQTVAENLVLALLGGAMGLLGAHWILRVIVPFFPHNIPRIEGIGIEWTVLAVALAISVFTAVLIGVAPALALRRLELAGAMQSGDASLVRLPGSFRLTNSFVALQVAISLVLLVGAGLTIRTLSALQNVDMGFRPDSVLTVRLSPPAYRYRSWEQVRQFQRQVLSEFEAQPGVASVALVMTLPLSGRSVKTKVAAEISVTELFAERNIVSENYFRVMQIPLANGRLFGAGDRKNTEPVVIVNRSLARQLWPAGQPVGKKIRIGGEWRTVVGIVHDEKHWSLDRPPEPKFYVAYEQDRTSGRLMSILTFLVIRTTGNPLQFAAGTRRTIWSVDKTMPVDNIQTMSQLVDDSIAVPRFRTMLLGILALLALIISMIGVYGVMAYSVARRTRDIGIGMALGAQRSHILRAVLLDGLRPALAGTLVGLGLSAALTRLLRNQLFGVEPLDAWAFGGAGAIMLAVAALACLIPARTATRVDPLIALRHN